MPSRFLPVLVAVLAWSLAGCSGESEGEEPPPVDYVALGDSYSAGPLIRTMRSDPTGCLRSSDNYPAFLADWLDVRSYRDVTCSGARTLDLTGAQRLPTGDTAPPQLDALSVATDLVTVSIGGNDFAVYGRLRDCAQRASACALDEADTLVRDAGQVQARVAAVLAEVSRRSPSAEVYVVGYPRIVPEQGTCPALGLSGAAADVARRVLARLNDSLAGAAETADATFVSLDAASRGHDVCAGEQAWINGLQPRPGEAAALHPFLAGMRGVAAVVHRAVTGQEAPGGADAEPDPEAVVRNPVSP